MKIRLVNIAYFSLYSLNILFIFGIVVGITTNSSTAILFCPTAFIINWGILLRPLYHAIKTNDKPVIRI